MYSNSLVCNILNFIENNINNKFSIQDIADYFFFNRFYIMKLFKKELKISINNYINIRRIYNSLTEIKSSNDSYLNIALNNGFNSLEYFSETFKNIIGVPPSTYKKFTYFIIKTTDKELEIIRENLYKISSIIYNIEKYKNNIKPELKKEKKLSIF